MAGWSKGRLAGWVGGARESRMGRMVGGDEARVRQVAEPVRWPGQAGSKSGEFRG